MEKKWLTWVTEIQSIAQAGLTFSENPYDIDRYKKLRELSVAIMQEYTGLAHEKLVNLFANETGYQTPKVDIRSAVFKGDSILMAKEKIDGKWSLPGGWADVNSTVYESAVRECSEEAGAIVKPKRIIAILTANRQNNFVYPYTIYKIFVECELIEWNFADNMETYGADFFSLENLPELSVERNNREQIELCFDAKNKPVFETVFD
ncbi:MAG TPA: NUDIX hydrolase N-terminal domain-containing protein [Bacteroidales bacterium]|nr:NUDIX hydrolase N-terminal domain-containing protein [Bacteroidales bacterium]